MNGTIINYYFHCKRQCYMFAHRLNLEDNSEIVKIGKAIHEDRARNSENTEIKIENIALDKINSKYVTEVKKSDADVEASKWQLLYYLKILKDKGNKNDLLSKRILLLTKSSNMRIGYAKYINALDKNVDDIIFDNYSHLDMTREQLEHPSKEEIKKAYKQIECNK